MDLPTTVTALLPTPVAQPSGTSAEAFLERKNRDGGARTTVTDLGMVVEQLLPTPTAMRAGGNRETFMARKMRTVPSATVVTDLAIVVEGLGSGPMPQRSDDKSSGTDPHPSPPPTGDSTPPSSSG